MKKLFGKAEHNFHILRETYENVNVGVYGDSPDCIICIKRGNKTKYFVDASECYDIKKKTKRKK